MQVGETERVEAIGRFTSLAGLSEAAASAIVDAALQASVDQTLELIRGGGPIPSNMTSAKADQLRFVCLRAGRILSQREVEVLFRITATQARSILTSMYATYETALREQFFDQMKEDADVVPSGTEEAGLTWTVRFTEASSFQFASAEIDRLGLDREATFTAARRTIVLPRKITRGGKQLDPLKELGLSKPRN